MKLYWPEGFALNTCISCACVIFREKNGAKSMGGDPHSSVSYALIEASRSMIGESVRLVLHFFKKDRRQV